MHNGYQNYETWLTVVWITNEESSYEYWREVTAEERRENKGDYYTTRYNIAKRIMEAIENYYLDKQAGLETDLLRAAIKRIDFEEVAEYFMEE